jgi:acyl-CoA-binding protein
MLNNRYYSMDMDKLLFDTAVEAVDTLTERPSDATLLELYGLYKQAKFGKCNTSQPWAIQVKERAKWDAWNALGDMSKKSAMQKYVLLVNKLATK